MSVPKYVPWTDEDIHALVRAAKELNARPMDLLAVLNSESALHPGSIAYYKGAPYARGLNQITPPNAGAMRLSNAEWESLTTMTPAQNLPYVVRSFRKAVGDRVYKDVGELYLVNFAPARLPMGTSDDVVLYSAPSNAYEANKPLDFDRKGYITVGDMRQRVLRDSAYYPFQHASGRLRALYPDVEEAVFTQGSADPLAMGAGLGGLFSVDDLWWIAGSAALAGAGVYAWKKGYVHRFRTFARRKLA